MISGRRSHSSTRLYVSLPELAYADVTSLSKLCLALVCTGAGLYDDLYLLLQGAGSGERGGDEKVASYNRYPVPRYADSEDRHADREHYKEG